MIEYFMKLISACCVLFVQEIRKLQTYRTQLDLCKRQAQELQLRAADETKRADKAEFDAKRVQEKLVTLKGEKEVGEGKGDGDDDDDDDDVDRTVKIYIL